MNSTKLRTITAAVIFTVFAVSLLIGTEAGTLSGFGIDVVSMLCPLGAFTTMIATKTFVPRAVISIVLMGILVFVVGRAFCGYICPVPLAKRVGAFFKNAKKRKLEAEARTAEMETIAKLDMAEAGHEKVQLTSAELEGIKHDCVACGACKQPRKALDSRHYVLGGALLSTAVFGFPVFCLICPIGLTFATVLIFWRMFAAGDVTIAAILVPAMLLIELVFLRKWCSRFCPMAALMNLVSRFSRTWVPTIDENKCIETRKGNACSKCAIACEADINLRHPSFGERTLADCTRCRACVEACPTHAVSMPFISRSKSGNVEPVMLTAEQATAGIEHA